MILKRSISGIGNFKSVSEILVVLLFILNLRSYKLPNVGTPESWGNEIKSILERGFF